MGRVLVTGGAGRIATVLRPLLRRPGRILRLADVVPIPPLAGRAGTDDGAGDDGAETLRLDITDEAAVVAACEGVDAIVHLAAIPVEAPLDDLIRVNVRGTANVLEGARRAGVGRVVLASSGHAVGSYTRADAGPDGLLPDDLPPRPDTYYGWSKAAGEALGSLYHDKFGLDVIALRIGTCFADPTGHRALDGWLSPPDASRLVEACLSAPAPGFRVVWGVSDNTRRWWSLAAAAELGYTPYDDAEAFATPWDEPPADPARHRVGGDWLDLPPRSAT